MEYKQYIDFKHKNKWAKAISLTIIISLFFIDSLIYLYTHNNIIIFDFINFAPKEYTILSNLPSWVIFNLPDGIWVSTFIYFLLYIWDFKITIESIIWILLAIIFSFFLEFCQKCKIVNGTYDDLDLFFMILGVIFTYLLTFKIITYEKQKI